MNRLLLGSGSPRRSELLLQLGLDFDVVRPEIDESKRITESAYEYVSRMSSEKFRACVDHARVEPNSVILCADTIVVIDDKVLGKPESKYAGCEMLKQLSGRSHQVITSVTVGLGEQNRNKSLSVATKVAFRRLTSDECESYWNTGEPVDKAGGYGIQGIGAIFVENITGSYSNVVGLPLAESASLLREFGISILSPLESGDRKL